MNVNFLTENFLYFIHGLEKYEKRLTRSQSYKDRTIVKWKKKSNISWSLAKKILSKLEIYNGQKVRSIINKIVEDNKDIFERDNCYLASFGDAGKSGQNILYDARNTDLGRDGSRFKSAHELTNMPSGSTIIFFDDLIGTGTQSVEYIQSKLNYLIQPSHKTYLVSICATPEGIKAVEDNSNFKVLAGVILNKTQYQFTDDECNEFSFKEKIVLRDLNTRLSKPNIRNYNQGLLLAFYSSTPNNCMPIIWKDKYKYKDAQQKDRQWLALLPRAY